MVDVLNWAGLEVRDELGVYCKDTARVGVFGLGAWIFSLGKSIACC